MTVTNKPVTGESTKETVKTIARGMSGVFRCDRGDLLACFLFLHARLRAHRAPGIPCALSSEGGEIYLYKPGRLRAAGRCEAVDCSSCPDLIRASINLSRKPFKRKMDRPVKPGDD